MTTTSLELSRQLQERFKNWRGSHWVWAYCTGKGFDPKFFDKFAIEGCIGWQRVNRYDAYREKEKYRQIDIVESKDLDELRVFALELIGPEPHYDLTTDANSKWEEWERLTNQLKDALIQGCDPTAEWILNTFGGK